MLEKLKNKITLVSTAIVTSPLFVNAEGEKSAEDYFSGVITKTETGGQAATLTKLSDTLKVFLSFIRGAGIIVCVIMLAWCAVQLAMSAGNNQKRQLAMEGIKNVLIAVAIIGSASLIAGLAYGLLA